MKKTIKPKQVEQYNIKQPSVEQQFSISNDGKWIIHKTTITHVRRNNYKQ